MIHCAMGFTAAYAFFLTNVEFVDVHHQVDEHAVCSVCRVQGERFNGIKKKNTHSREKRVASVQT